MDSQENDESLTAKILEEEYKKYENIDKFDVNVEPKEGDVVQVSKIVKKDNNYFKADAQVEQEILKMVKQEYKKMTQGAPDEVRILMEKFEPWNYYEDKKGINCFRVAGISEIEIEEGKFVLGLHCFKVGSQQVDEIIGVNPDNLVRVHGWKRHQISLISQCNIPEAFIRPLGYLLLQEMAAEANNSLINKIQSIDQ
jgi:hypothetical protein